MFNLCFIPMQMHPHTVAACGCSRSLSTFCGRTKECNAFSVSSLSVFACVTLPVNMYACMGVLLYHILGGWLVCVCVCIYKPYSSDMLPLAVVFAGNSQRVV